MIDKTNTVPTSDDRDPDDKHRPLVLVVDDSPIDRSMAGNILRKRAGTRVTFAEHGKQALEALEQEKPDVILTDMQMPEMDGLALVEWVRRQLPLVPTILMTAHGSEETAMLALQRGAASYVPKRFLAEWLVDSVKEVLSVSGADREQQRLSDCWKKTEFEFSLDNDATLIPALVNHLQHYIVRVRDCDETEVVRLGVALHEAMRNAIHHGNLELDSELRQENPDEYYRAADVRRHQPPYRDRRVRVTASESPGESRYVIADQGPGFDTQRTSYNPHNNSDLMRNSGRGLFLIRTFMDEVRFNERGNEITMIHRRQG